MTIQLFFAKNIGDLTRNICIFARLAPFMQRDLEQNVNADLNETEVYIRNGRVEVVVVGDSSDDMAHILQITKRNRLSTRDGSCG